MHYLKLIPHGWGAWGRSQKLQFI